jgi:YidC/Oxa1 family membrane protein insertase
MFETWSAYRQYKKLSSKNKTLVIYSEGAQYWRLFAPIVQQLSTSYEHKICYVSSDRADPGLEQENTIGIYIGEGFWRTTWFHTLQAKVVLMTMPDLHLSHLKRSKYPVHYSYLFHALMSSHSPYLENAFDHYDSIFCATQYHLKEIRQTEKIYRLTEKKLIPAGYPLLDDLMQEFKQYQPLSAAPSNTPLSILYAPSWGEKLSLVNYGEDLIQTLLDGGNRVVFRPHPHSFKAHQQLTERLINKHIKNPLFHYQPPNSDNTELFNCDLLITDWSGIGFEFAFVMKKPILFIDTPMKIRNPNYHNLQIEPFEATYRKNAGKIIKPEEIVQINTIITELVANFSACKNNPLVEQVFNLGKSAEVVAYELVKLTQTS